MTPGLIRLEELRRRASATGSDHYTRKLRELAQAEIRAQGEPWTGATPAPATPAETPPALPPLAPSPAPVPATPPPTPSTTTATRLSARQLATLRAIAGGRRLLREIAVELKVCQSTASTIAASLIRGGYLRPYARRRGVPAPPMALTAKGCAAEEASRG